MVWAKGLTPVNPFLFGKMILALQKNKSMFNFSLRALVLLLITGFTFSCNSAGENKEEPAEDKTGHEFVEASDGKSLLWEISGNGLEEPSYLFGTTHIIPSEDFFSEPGFDSACVTSDRVIFEIDLDDPSMMTDAAKAMMMPDGESLDMYMSEEDYAYIDGYMQENFGYGISVFNKMKPFALLTILIEQLGEGDIQAYESYFQDLAEDRGKEILGLESITDQIGLFDAIPYPKMIEMVKESIADFDSDVATEQFETMIEMYKDQDIEGLNTFILEEMDEYGEFDDLLLYGRNRNWIPLIVDYAEQGQTFFAVGAGHLGGEQGVISLLKAEGYTVTPVH